MNKENFSAVSILDKELNKTFNEHSGLSLLNDSEKSFTIKQIIKALALIGADNSENIKHWKHLKRYSNLMIKHLRQEI